MSHDFGEPRVLNKVVNGENIALKLIVDAKKGVDYAFILNHF